MYLRELIACRYGLEDLMFQKFVSREDLALSTLWNGRDLIVERDHPYITSEKGLVGWVGLENGHFC